MARKVLICVLFAFFAIMTFPSEVMADAISAGNLNGYEKEWNINGEKVTLAVVKK